MTVRNGTTATTGWNVTWTFADGQTISQVWNGTSTQTGATVTVRNAAWNGALAAGGDHHVRLHSAPAPARTRCPPRQLRPSLTTTGVGRAGQRVLLIPFQPSAPHRDGSTG